MSGYRDDKKLSALDRQTLGWHAAHYGIGLLAISLFMLVTGSALIYSVITFVIGAPLLAYGMRKP